MATTFRDEACAVQLHVHGKLIAEVTFQKLHMNERHLL